jgi:hypothetical protein
VDHKLCGCKGYRWKTNIPPVTVPPSHAVLPFSNHIPYLITHQAFAQEPWIRNTNKVQI